MQREFVCQQRQNYKTKSFSWHELPVNNALGLTEKGKIHLRMHTGKMSNDILKPLSISLSDIVCELLLCLFEGLNLLSQGLNLLSQFTLNLPRRTSRWVALSSNLTIFLPISRYALEGRKSGCFF